MNNGWIKLHRKLTEKGYYKNSCYVHLWLHLLFLASHSQTEFLWNGKIQKLAIGQFLTGRKQLAQQTGIPETTIERILKCFESEQQIGQQKTNKNRIITILNYETYQKVDSRTDTKRTTDGQPVDTFKELKKVKNDKNTSKTSVLQGEQWNILIDAFKEVNPMYLDFYKNKTERNALETLVERLGFDKVKGAIENLHIIISQPYAPRITKPSELKRDLGKLAAFYKQKREGQKINTQPTWKIWE